MVETLLREEAEFDEDQHFILTEAVRYLVSEAPGTSLQVRAGQTLDRGNSLRQSFVRQTTPGCCTPYAAGISSKPICAFG